MTEERTYPHTLTLPSDREIVMERMFDAPPELVFRAYTDAELIPKWFGFRTSTTIVDKLDLRPGGAWRYVGTNADGSEHAFRGEFREISPPTKLVWTFEYEPMPGHILEETITFEPVDGKTKLTSVSVFDSKEDRDGMLNTGMEGGAAESNERLDELLTELQGR
jgi:uncharacterized protein YndB with AHSA1/START domain